MPYDHTKPFSARHLDAMVMLNNAGVLLQDIADRRAELRAIMDNKPKGMPWRPLLSEEGRLADAAGKWRFVEVYAEDAGLDEARARWH